MAITTQKIRKKNKTHIFRGKEYNFVHGEQVDLVFPQFVVEI